ncbi:MAG: diguanylate cyclase [Desulfomonile sp.]|nr:diguanylate cyclase [Desulfomonile sp.]
MEPEQPQQPVEPTTSDLEEPRSPAILVVDDDNMVREVIVESIRAAGLDVDVCHDGATALEKSKLGHYELIVTDMRLPRMDGLTLIRHLKAGALDYLIKPFTVEQIQLSVQKALELRELRRRAKEREFYRELSYVDPLTTVYNRRHFDEALDREIRKAKLHTGSLVLVMLDIDDFKIYNDLHGHQKGDEALVHFGQILKSACRASDIVSRYGGEEFAVIFPGAGKEQAPELCSRIMSRVQEFPFEGAETLPFKTMTVSIGAACFPEDASSATELVRLADNALYRAKKSGKNTVRLALGPHAS